MVPNETPNEQQQTLTTNNPGLLPQMSENWDATLDYYFEPVGDISIGWFHKRITDYIVSGIAGSTIGTGPDNGYGVHDPLERQRRHRVRAGLGD